MRNKVQVASGIAVAATLLTAVLAGSGSGALAEAAHPVIIPELIQSGSDIETEAQDLPATGPEAVAVAPAGLDEEVARAATLADHVRVQPRIGVLDDQLRCLAGAIYFEARGESLEGQLAVGRVVVDRAKSGRFPASYCGVVFQRSQFSFVRGQTMPRVNEHTAAWQRAVAIARVADEGSWQSPTDGALFFHATHVSPRWRLKRLARVDNHIFYR